MANNSLDLIELDPNTLKADFKNWLRNNEQFKDYDYDGSNMNQLLDIFAYNTHKNAFFTNMGISEAFLDSAQLRSSVLSHAKHLNYLPDSYRSSHARIKVEFEATGETAPYIVEKGSPFTAIIKNDSYTFTVAENITVASANNSYEFEADIYEGIFLRDTYTYDSDAPENNIFRISNKNVDLNSLTVTVFEDGNTEGDLYVYTPTLLDINDKSKVFMLQASLDNSYEIVFGDSNIGRQPKDDSTIVIEYRVSSGKLGDGAATFSMDFDPTNNEGTTTATVRTLQVSKNGASEESMESIKYLAPRHFQVQERCVTHKDYEIVLKKKFPEINDIFAYGGEELLPPENGKVFVSIDLQDINGIPESKKQEYTKFLEPRRSFGTRVFFIEPEYSYIYVNSRVRYNSNITTLSKQSIKAIVEDVVVDFNKENLDKFDAILRYSKLESAIDEADPSIVSSFSNFRLYKKLDVKLGVSNDIDVVFGAATNDLRIKIPKNHDKQYGHVCWSSEFYYKNQLCRLEDNGEGIMVVVKLSGINHNFLSNAGTIDYSTGAVSIRNFQLNSIVGSTVNLFLNPIDKDFRSYRNNILAIEPESIIIRPEELRL